MNSSTTHLSVKLDRYKERRIFQINFIFTAKMAQRLEHHTLGDLALVSEEARDALFAVLGPRILRGQGTGEDLIDIIVAHLGEQMYLTQAKVQPVVEESMPERVLAPEVQAALLLKLKARFEEHADWHKGTNWVDLQASLEADPALLWSLNEMEKAGHEPDLILEDGESYLFGTCSEESPETARNTVYDAAAQIYLESNYPEVACNGNAVDMAKAMGINLMSEGDYRILQTLGRFDRNSWSWLATPEGTRDTGFALCANRVDESILVIPSPARDLDSVGGFRGSLRVPKLKA